MKIKLKVTLFCITILLFSMIISKVVIAAEEQKWQPVPEANYAEIIELVALRAKANYEEISSWQGRMNIIENLHFYGPDAAENALSVDMNSIARNSRHICEMGNTFADFSLDMRNNKLYSSIEPNVQYKAVDLNQYVPRRKYTSTPKTKTIVSPENSMWFMPDKMFSSNLQSLPAQKMVFIESPENKNVKGFVLDPRDYFDFGGRKLWDTLLTVRKGFIDNGNVRIDNYPNIEITSLKTATGTKYRILTTWKGGDNAVTKYMRPLLEVDESLGFNATMYEITNSDGIKLTSEHYTYQKIGELYVPQMVEKEQHNNKGEVTLTSEITIETTGINRPLPEDTFTIKNLGVEEDTIVNDKIKKAEFRYSKGNLVPIADANR